MDSSLGPESHPLLSKVDKQALLALCPLFAGLSQWELKSISQLMRLVEYKKEEVVYHEGADASGFYVVVSGRFEAVAVVGGKKKVLAYLRRGDYFGEMSLLTSQPHSATLKALSDGLTLELRKEDFRKTIESNATISLELSRRLSSRLKGVDPKSRSLLRSDVISVYSNQRRTGRTSFAINLAASLHDETRQRTMLLDLAAGESGPNLPPKTPISRFIGMESQAPEALSQSIAKHPAGFDILSLQVDERDQAGDALIIPLLNHLAIEYRFILIDLPGWMDDTVMKALSQSDFAFFVTDSNINNITETRDTVDEIEKTLSLPREKTMVAIQEVFFGIRTTATIKKELFGDRICYSLPAAPAAQEFDERGNPFVVDEPHAEYSRVVRHIARRLSNNLVGLALGSGAALGLAHVGVLKVFERERIPVDVIAGSSIGSLIGSLYAIGKTSEEIEDLAYEINSRAKLAQMLDFSIFPIRGLLHGQGILKHLKKAVGNRTFDDCKIPLKIIGANLSTRQPAVLDTGFILDAVRTSIAIPAIFKPVIRNGDIFVDGGILSPLPVRALHQAGANKVIAVNVFPSTKDMLERRILYEQADEQEAKMLRQKSWLTRLSAKMKKKLAASMRANVFDVLMNTIQSMEAEIADAEGQGADILLRPVVPDASWVEFYKPAMFIRRGEEEAEKMLPKIKQLVASQNL